MAEGRSSHTLELIIEAKDRADAALNSVKERVQQVDQTIRGVGQQFQAAGNQINGVANQIGGALGGMAQSFTGSIDPLKVGLDQVSKGVQAVHSHVTNLSGGFAGLVAAVPIVATLGAAMAYLSKSLEDSSQATVKMMQLRAAWAASERGTSGDFDNITAQIKEMASTSSQSAGSLMSAFKGMVTMPGIATENIIPALRASIDLAAASGRPLEEAAHALGYASMGWTRALRSFGMVVKQTSPEAKDFGLLIGEVNKRFGGQDAARMQTYIGAVDLLNKSMGETRKAVGSMVEGAALAPMQNLAAFFKDLSTEAKDFFKGEGAEAWRARLEPAFQRVVDFIKQLVSGFTEFLKSDKFPGLVDGILKVGQAMQWVMSAAASVVGWFASMPGWVYKALFAFIGLRVVIGILRSIFGLFVSGAVSVARYFGITIPWLVKEAAAAREAARAYMERNTAATGILHRQYSLTGPAGKTGGTLSKYGNAVGLAGAGIGLLGATYGTGTEPGKQGQWTETAADSLGYLAGVLGIGAVAANFIPAIGQVGAAVLGMGAMAAAGLSPLVRWLGSTSDQTKEVVSDSQLLSHALIRLSNAAALSGKEQEDAILAAAREYALAGKTVEEFGRVVRRVLGKEIPEDTKEIFEAVNKERVKLQEGMDPQIQFWREQLKGMMDSGDFKEAQSFYTNEISKMQQQFDERLKQWKSPQARLGAWITDDWEKQRLGGALKKIYFETLQAAADYKKAVSEAEKASGAKEAGPEGWELQKARSKAYYDELARITSAYYEQERTAIWRNAASSEQAEKQITALKSAETLDRMKRLEEQYKTDTELRNKQRDEELSRKTDLQEDEKKQIREKYQKEELSAFEKHQTDVLKVAEDAEKEIQKLYKERLDAQQKMIEAQISGQAALDSINAKAQTSFQNLQTQIIRAREETQRAIDLLPTQPEKAMQVAEAARQKWVALSQDVKGAQDALINASQDWDEWFRQQEKKKMVTPGERWQSDIQAVYRLQAEARQAAAAGDLDLAKKRIEAAKSLVRSTKGEVENTDYETATMKTASQIRASEMMILRQAVETGKKTNDEAISETKRLTEAIKSIWTSKINENTAALVKLTGVLKKAYGIVEDEERPEGQKVPGTPEAGKPGPELSPSQAASAKMRADTSTAGGLPLLEPSKIPVVSAISNMVEGASASVQKVSLAVQRYGNTAKGAFEFLTEELGVSFKKAMRTVQDLWGIRGGLTLKERTGAAPITDESRQRVAAAWEHGLESWFGPKPSAWERREWKRTAGEPALNQMRSEVDAAYADQAERERKSDEWLSSQVNASGEPLKPNGPWTGGVTYADTLLLDFLEAKNRVKEWAGGISDLAQTFIEPFKSRKEEAGTSSLAPYGVEEYRRRQAEQWGFGIIDKVQDAGLAFRDQTSQAVEPFRSDKTEDSFGQGVGLFAATAEKLDTVMSRIEKAVNDAIKVNVVVKQDGSVVATVGGGEYQGALG